MKITDVKVREIRTEVPTVSGGTYQITSRQALLLKVSTDEGLESEVCLGNEQGYSPKLKAYIRGPLRERIVGSDPLLTLGVWKTMFTKAGGPDRADSLRATSMVDICLWDLKGKALGQPVWKLMGGGNPKIPIIAIGGYYETSSDEAGITAEIANLKANGIGGMKFKVGARALEFDAERVHLARKAGGPDFNLVVDSNTSWMPRDAVRFAAMIYQDNPRWLEEPVRWQNYIRGLREVRYKTGVRVGAGQSELSAFDCYQMLESDAVDVINVTATRGGGITGWSMLAHAAHINDVDMAQVAEPHLGMQLMAGIPNPTHVECYAAPERDPFWTKLYTDRPQPKDGFITAPDKPGFGLTLNQDVVESFAIEAYS